MNNSILILTMIVIFCFAFYCLKIPKIKCGGVSSSVLIVAAILLLLLALLGMLFKRPIIILLLVIVAIWIRYIK